MKYGKLFTKLMGRYPQMNNLSSNRFSSLKYRELRTIAKCLHTDGHLLGNYTHDNHNQLASRVYTAVSNMN